MSDQRDLFGGGAPPAAGGGGGAGGGGAGRGGGGGRGGSGKQPAWRDAPEASGSGAPTAPLAERMRPRTIDEIVGQRHLLGPNHLLRRAIERDEVPSMILWGPPGSGKTTLARVIAAATPAGSGGGGETPGGDPAAAGRPRIKRTFVPFSAVLGGVAEVRAIIAEAQERTRRGEGSTVLFVDEIHRFNKAQQDAFLPHVERGTVTLIGATTENPSFALNAALLSRARVYVLQALTEDDLHELLERAMRDSERGLGALQLQHEPEALRHLAQAAFGDARRALSALEVAASSAASREDRTITLADAEEAIARRSLLYDKAGEQHYDMVSAFIKSMRGSDPDAALYYAVRMLESGEDPRFVIRRMVIFAAEDIGLADPRALTVAMDCQRAFEFVGWPEGYLPISMAIAYLAAAPKSNSALAAWGAAKADVLAHGPLPVPMHIRNAPTGLMKDLGYGRGYEYPHDYPGHHVPTAYLPEALLGRSYYQPSDQGLERQIGERVRALRTAVAAAIRQK